MPTHGHAALQQAIYTRLTANATLMAAVEGIFDHVPQGSEYPYIMIGDDDVRDWSTTTTKGSEHTYTLHLWSREGGRSQIALLMEQLHALLHDASFTVSGFSLVLNRFVSSEIELENDGWTYHGMMRFRALLQSN